MQSHNCAALIPAGDAPCNSNAMRFIYGFHCGVVRQAARCQGGVSYACLGLGQAPRCWARSPRWSPSKGAWLAKQAAHIYGIMCHAARPSNIEDANPRELQVMSNIRLINAWVRPNFIPEPRGSRHTWNYPLDSGITNLNKSH